MGIRIKQKALKSTILELFVYPPAFINF